MYLDAHFQQHPDISISLTIYNMAHATTRRDFYLRNLAGNSEAEQLEHARQIMNEVAREIHYLTSLGVDKGEIKAGKRKVIEEVYADLQPNKYPYFFLQGALFKFAPVSCYVWVKENRKSWRILETVHDENWQVETVTDRKGASFRLPCVLAGPSSKSATSEEKGSFFGKLFPPSRKKKKTGYRLDYDRNDPTFLRFMGRFYKDGNLSFGKKHFFLPDNTSIDVVECKWPQSKPKPEKQPRRSKLASQPVDDTDYVYLTRMGRTKYYKIGKTNDPQGRLASLQTANPQKLTLLHTFKADNATAAEEDLHSALHHQRRTGEWFQLADEQKAALVAVIEYKDHHFITNSQAVKVKEGMRC